MTAPGSRDVPAPADPGALARVAAIVLGATVGALLRHGHALLLNGGPGTFPWGTVSINVAGSVALAALLAALVDRPGAHPLWRPFFAVGFCGTYTTFSSFESETLGLVRGGESGLAALYAGASLALGIGAALGAWRLVRHHRPRWEWLDRRPPLVLAPVLAVLAAAATTLVLGRQRDLALEPAAIASFAVVLGGSAGALARYAAGSLIAARLGSSFPWGTLFINLTGSFLIGIFDGATRGRTDVSPYLRPLCVTGWLGGYTTFSTFACDTTLLGSGEGRKRAAANVLASFLGGFAAVAAGDALGARL